jgi:hypothetical protein
MKQQADPSQPFVPGEGDPEPMGTAMTVVLGAILLFVIVVGLQALFYQTRDDEVAAKSYAQPPQELAQVRSEQLERIRGYHWVDQPHGVVAIPIDRAMDLIVEEARAESLRSRPAQR